jgi:hypothetical protein
MSFEIAEAIMVRKSMSALGHKRTSGKARRDVRFTPDSGHQRLRA